MKWLSCQCNILTMAPHNWYNNTIIITIIIIIIIIICYILHHEKPWHSHEKILAIPRSTEIRPGGWSRNAPAALGAHPAGSPCSMAGQADGRELWCLARRRRSPVEVCWMSWKDLIGCFRYSCIHITIHVCICLYIYMYIFLDIRYFWIFLDVLRYA